MWSFDFKEISGWLKVATLVDSWHSLREQNFINIRENFGLLKKTKKL